MKQATRLELRHTDDVSLAHTHTHTPAPRPQIFCVHGHTVLCVLLISLFVVAEAMQKGEKKERFIPCELNVSVVAYATRHTHWTHTRPTAQHNCTTDANRRSETDNEQ